MPFVRRSLAALSGLFLLQLLLLGSGTLCAMHHAASRDNADAMHGMSGMSSGPATRASVSAMPQAERPINPTDCGGMGEHGGCGLPWAPGQCSSMTACDVSATPAASIVASGTVPARAFELPSPALIHSGPIFAPELPPPRA